MAEYTSSIKSSGTQFYKPDLVSEMLTNPASGLRAHTTFGCDCFGGSWRSNGVFVEKLLPVYGYNIRGTDREYNFQGKLIAPTSHLAQLGITYNFSSA